MPERPAKIPSVPVDATLPHEGTVQDQPSAPGLPMLAPPQQADEMGRLGNYRVLKVLGRGGMGVVFLAEDPQLGRSVALKVMLPDMASRPEARERFLREARAAAALDHDHVVAIYQVGEDRGIPFLAMPLLRGMSLEDYLGRGKPLPLAQILRIGREAARGLQAAHEKGLIHRDVKPANLWLDGNAAGRVKLLDFGLAQARATNVQLTASGVIMGTPAYMAPEQIAGHAEASSDLYSLGVVLYRMLTGRLPFPQTEMFAVLVAIATEEPPPLRTFAPDVPESVVGLVMRLLAKKPGDRPGTAREVVEEIRKIERGQVPETQTIPPPRLSAPPPPPPVAKTELIPVPRRRKKARPAPSWQRWAIIGGTAALVVMTALVVVLLTRTGKRPKDTSKPSIAREGVKAPPVKGSERPAGFVSLFDGKSLDGWAKRGDAEGWEAHDGILLYQGPGRGLLRTVKTYANYELDLEWRIPPRSNSGVFLRLAGFVTVSPKTINEGVEVQILDDPSYPTVDPTTFCSALFNIQAPSKSLYIGPDQWHRFQIRCEGKRIMVRCNGKVVVDTRADINPKLEALPEEGSIGLQNWGSSTEFRNIFIKELPPSP